MVDYGAFTSSFPRSSNAGVSLKIKRSPVNSIDRSTSIRFDVIRLEQLQMGIRYFDLRVCRTTNGNHAKNSPFTFTHGFLGDLVRPRLDEINRYLEQHSKEIVLLDFNHFYDFNDQCGHDQLIHLIHDVFGSKLCTTARIIHDCTLNYLWSHGQQVILLYDHQAEKCSAYMDRVGHFFQVDFRFFDPSTFHLISTRCVNPRGPILSVQTISLLFSTNACRSHDKRTV